jgi:protein SCO1
MTIVDRARLRLLGLVLASALATLPGGARSLASLAPDELAQVGVSPPPGARLPLDAPLTDLDGRPTTLGQAIGGRPAAVIFADYDCTQLCSPILGLANAALKSSGLRPGADYRLVVIGFNPRATLSDARRMIEGEIGSMTAIGRATLALSATEPIATQLTSAVGYRYLYDPENARYAHPAAILIVTASGRLSRVLSGLAISGDDVRLALVEAGKGAIGQIADQIRLLCYGFSASVGFYDDPIRMLLIAAGIATLVSIAGGLAMLARASARRRA